MLPLISSYIWTCHVTHDVTPISVFSSALYILARGHSAFLYMPLVAVYCKGRNDCKTAVQVWHNVTSVEDAWLKENIQVSVKWNAILMQHCAGFISAGSLYMFRASSAHHQEYLKLVQRPLVRVLSLQVSHHISLLGPNIANGGPTCNHNYLYQWLPC